MLYLVSVQKRGFLFEIKVCERQHLQSDAKPPYYDAILGIDIPYLTQANAFRQILKRWGDTKFSPAASGDILSSEENFILKKEGK